MKVTKSLNLDVEEYVDNSDGEEDSEEVSEFEGDEKVSVRPFTKL